MRLVVRFALQFSPPIPSPTNSCTPHLRNQQNSDATGRDLDTVASSELPLPSPMQYIQAIMTKNHNQRHYEQKKNPHESR